MGTLALKALGLVKEAATRQVKEIRRLIQEGKMDEAAAMANKLQEAGVLKRTAMGTPVKRLGAGREGIADLVLGASDAPVGHELSVRKSYDPKASMYNPVVPNRKVQIGQELANDPKFARMFTQDAARAAGNVPYHVGEFVPGRAVADTRGYANAPTHVAPAVERGHRAAEKVLGQPAVMHDVLHDGLLGKRVHGDNVRVTPTGGHKIIDYLPFTAEEMKPTGFFGQHTTEDLRKMYPNLTDEHLRIEGSGGGHTLNANQQNIVEGYKQLGGSKQEAKVRGAKIDSAEAVNMREGLQARLAEVKANKGAPPAGSAAPTTAAARPVPAAPPAAPPPVRTDIHAGGALHANQLPTNLRPTPAPSLLSKFHNLSTAGKAGVVGGGVLGAGLLGYGAYRMMRPKQQPALPPRNIT